MLSWLVTCNSLPVEGKASCEDGRESEVHATWETAEETTAQRISPHPWNIQQPARTSGLAVDGYAIHRETTKMRHFRFSLELTCDQNTGETIWRAKWGEPCDLRTSGDQGELRRPVLVQLQPLLRCYSHLIKHCSLFNITTILPVAGVSLQGTGDREENAWIAVRVGEASASSTPTWLHVLS